MTYNQKFSPMYPQALQPGDTIAVISPAGPSTQEQLNEGILYLEQLGYRVKLMPHARDRWQYMAGRDEDRLADVHAAFADPEVKAILAARGGYGCMHLLPHLDWDLIQANPKILIGFSDLTALLLPIYQRTGLVGFHGPMLTSNLIDRDAYSQAELWKQVIGNVSYPYIVPNPRKHYCFTPGTVEGPIMGGNLSLLTALCGTPYQPDARGHILFIEDWHESYYTLDRKITQLRLAGLFDGILGLVLGDFTALSELETPETVPVSDFLRDITSFVSVPRSYGFALGHADQTSTLPIGATARFEAESGRFQILHAPVLQPNAVRQT